MEPELGNSLIQNYAIYAASISAILSALLIVYKKVVKPMIQHFKQWYDMLDKVDAIFEEITPNGGKSIKDKIDKIDKRLMLVGERFRTYIADGEAYFEADVKGNVTHVNRTYTRLVGRDASEVLGQGWQNVVAHKDRERVVKAWEGSLDDGRELTIELDFERPSGRMIPIRAQTYKMVTDEGEIVGYIGKVTPKKPKNNA